MRYVMLEYAEPQEDEARQEQDDVPEAAEQAPEDDAAVQEN